VKYHREKISKGYRLKPETHEKIKKVKIILDSDTDYALNKACEKLLKEIENYKTIKGTVE